MRKKIWNGPHMTGPNADAAASCGDDALSQNASLKRRIHTKAQKTAGGQICTQLGHAPLMAIYQQRCTQHHKLRG